MNLPETLRRVRDQNGTILVIGLGISGIDSAKYLHSQGFKVSCVEREEESAYFSRSKFKEQAKALRAGGVALFFGIKGEDVIPLIGPSPLAVVSPGVPLESGVW